MINITLISFLGPKGTFTHEAASMLGDELIPYCTIPAVMESVANGETRYGIVPIENSIEGSVGVTLDSLAHKFDLKIYKEIIIPISQNLIVNPGCSLEDIEDIESGSMDLEGTATETDAIATFTDAKTMSVVNSDEIEGASYMMVITDEPYVYSVNGGKILYYNKHAELIDDSTVRVDGKGKSVIIYEFIY